MNRKNLIVLLDLLRCARVDAAISLIEAELDRPQVNKAGHPITRLVLDTLALFPEGLTDEEGQSLTGLSGNSWRPCRVCLVELGHVTETPARRATMSGRPAIVWALTREGAALSRQEEERS